MDETNSVKTVREERVSGHIKRKRPKKSWDEVVKEDIKKKDSCIMMAKTETKTSGDDVAEEWSIPVNWEDPAITAERRRSGYCEFMVYFIRRLVFKLKSLLPH